LLVVLTFFVGNFDFPSIDLLNDGVGVALVDGASNRLGCAEDFLDGARELLGHTAFTHGAGDRDDVVQGQVTAVLDVLDLLAVTWGLLEGLDDEGGSAGNDLDTSLTVLDDQLDGDLQALPARGGLGDVVTDLLGRQTKGTDLGGKGRSCWHFTSHSPTEDCGDGSWVKLGGHFDSFLVDD